MPPHLTSVTNHIFILKINAVEHGSAVNIGENHLTEWSNSTKMSQGYGQNFGDASEFIGLNNEVDDRDLIDSPSGFKSNVY